MSTFLQLRLDAFDRSLDPLCNDCPDRNGFRRLCYQCPFAVRSADAVYCERFSIDIRAQEKYALPGWKAIRSAILERDGQRCTICGGERDLHIHHLDRDPTNDDPVNLLTLCGICHARVHTELRREGGVRRVARVLPAVRCRAARLARAPVSGETRDP